MRKSAFLFALAVLVAPSAAFAQQKSGRITYDDHVLPILKEKCASCHNQDKKRSGLVVNNYTALMQGGSSGVSVKPGDPDGSLLYKVTAHLEEPFMPPRSPKIAKEKLDLIHRWIAGGAPENSGSKVVVTRPKVDFTLPKVSKGRPDGPPPMPPTNLRLDPVIQTSRPAAVTALAASPWAPLVAVGGQKQVLLYHADTLNLLGVLPFPEGVPQVLRFSRNGSLLLAGGGHPGKSGRVVVWSVTKGSRVFEVGDETDSVLAADISPDQSRIALGGPSKVVRLYSTRDGKLQHEIRKHTDWVTALEFSPDGVLLATGDRNGGLHVWEAFTAREFFTLRGHTAAITEISWRPDSNVVASSSEDTTVRLYEMENGNQVRSWGAHGGGALSVRYGHDGNLASAGRDRLAKLWNGNGGAIRAFEALPEIGLRAVVTHDNKRVVASDWVGTVRVFNAADGKRLGELAANPASARDKLVLAQKELVKQSEALKPLLKAAADAKLVAQKAASALQAAQASANSMAAAAKATDAELKMARDAHDRARAPLLAAQAEARAKGLLAQALQEAAAKVKAVADKAKGDKALQAAATKAQGLAAQASAELAQANNQVANLSWPARQGELAVTAAQKLAGDAAAVAAKAAQPVPALAAALKSAQASEAATKAAADKVAAEVTRLQAEVARLQGGATVATRPGK